MKLIELHVRLFGGKIRRVSVPTESIFSIRESRTGVILFSSCRDSAGFFLTLHCIESYDEVMALINRK